LPLELARFAALGFVSKIFLMVELLFAGRKNKIRRAVLLVLLIIQFPGDFSSGSVCALKPALRAISHPASGRRNAF
jgi:hypothetical protein